MPERFLKAITGKAEEGKMKKLLLPFIAYAFIICTNLLHEGFHYLANSCHGSISLTDYGFGGSIHYTASHGTFEAFAGGFGVFVVYVVIGAILARKGYGVAALVLITVAITELLYSFCEAWL